MNREDLTPNQLRTVETTVPVVLATGGPGSGKTTTALWAGREAIITGRMRPGQNVLFLTFSRSAVGQIGRRAPGVLSGIRDRIDVMTFHGLAYRLITAYGRYAGLRKGLVRIQSEAARKLLGAEDGVLAYDDLVPAALRLLENDRIWALAHNRWPLIISDEFQDTGKDQWSMILSLAQDSRLILLADPDQMIHSFRPDVGPERLAQAKELADLTVELEERSFRDPSGIIPAVARAVLHRDFANPAFAYAVEKERLRVRRDVGPESLTAAVVEEVMRHRERACRTVGVFGFTNHGSSDLAVELSSIGVSNAIIGLPESHGEGINTMAVLTGHAVGLRSIDDMKVAMATFGTACRRGAAVPPVALMMIGKEPMEPALDGSLNELSSALREAAEGTVSDVLKIVAKSWPSLFRAGSHHWRRAFANFAALADDIKSRPASADSMQTLIERCGLGRSRGLVHGEEETRTRAIQLMNFHQTKGREADGVILVFRHNDFYARSADREPFVERSRLLFVAISRARSLVTVILPPHPHALVEPFLKYS